MQTRTLQIDPIPIPLGNAYALPGGVVIWHYPPLPEGADDETARYRRAQIAALDLAGHRVIETMLELAEILNEVRE